MKEAEGEYLSRTILDEIGQTLAGLCFGVAELEKHLQKGDLNEKRDIILKQMYEMQITLKLLIETSRDLAATIRPSALEDLGFVETLTWYALDVGRKHGIICDTHDISEISILQPEKAISLFRCCQEIFNNIIEHSNASKVSITCKDEENTLVLRIIDNGVGISDYHISNPESTGIMKIRDLVTSLGGEVVFRSRHNRGTSVNINIPHKT